MLSRSPISRTMRDDLLVERLCDVEFALDAMELRQRVERSRDSRAGPACLRARSSASS